MTTSQEHWEREQWRVPKVRHTISLDDMLQYIDEKGDELVLYASCSDAQKRLYVKLRGGYRVMHIDTTVYDGTGGTEYEGVIRLSDFRKARSAINPKGEA